MSQALICTAGQADVADRSPPLKGRDSRLSHSTCRVTAHVCVITTNADAKPVYCMTQENCTLKVANGDRRVICRE